MTTTHALPPSLELPRDAPPVLVFDVETNGGSPQLVCQLAFVLVREGVVYEGSWIFQLPDGETISWRAFNVHGIRLQTCKQHGLSPAPVIEYFLCKAHEIRQSGGLVVAHNKGGDVAALRNTAVRWGCPFDLDPEDVYCTQANSTCFSPHVKKDGRPKPFRNSELYEYFYGGAPEWAKLHDALDDVKITLLNVKAMMEHGRVKGIRLKPEAKADAEEDKSGEQKETPLVATTGTVSRFFV